MTPIPVPHSAVEGVAWPALPQPAATSLLAVMHQLERSERLPPDALQALQFRQLAPLVAHAAAMPFWAERLRAAGIDPRAVTPEAWARLPPLRRRAVQDAGSALWHPAPPRAHGAVVSDTTSGSTGMPVRVRKTELAQAFWQAITLREELWHGRDFSAKLAVIRRWSADDRARPPDGMKLPDWGPPVATVYPTGAFALLDVRSTVTEQAAWLRRENPGWLLAFPSNLRFLARHCRDHAIAVPGLRGCRTFGEMLTDDTRAAVRDAWGVEIADMYSAVEVGYIALQCPAAPHYHVQAESALVEVLDAEGRPCGPGAVGEVVVTSLHNFAMPLLRYAIGDLAEVGPPCPCGRGLPVLRRILGRAKDMVVLPSGERRVALFGGKGFAAIEALLQYQLVQTTRDALELHVVTRRPLAAAEEDRLRATIRSSLGHDFAIAFVYRDEIARSASGKYEDFRSELPG